MKRVKRIRLDRTESRRYQEDPGGTAELLAEQEYDPYSRSLAENFDLATKSGYVGEVKSAQSVYPSGEKGRFRLFKTQHERLLQADRDLFADYFFLVFDVQERPLTARLKRMNPADVGYTIGARGGWYNAGHVAGKEYKMPIEAIF